MRAWILSHLDKIFTKMLSWLGHVDLFEEAFTHSASGMALVSLEGEWLKINEAVALLLERPEKEILKHTFQDYTPDDGGLQEDIQYLTECLAGTRTSYKMRKSYLMPDGRLKPSELSVVLIKIGDRPVFFLSQIVSIEEQVNLQRQMSRLLTDQQELNTRLKEEVILLRQDGQGRFADEFDALLDFNYGD